MKNRMRIIDCSKTPDLLAGWPVASIVRSSRTARVLVADLAGWALEGADLGGKSYAIDLDTQLIQIDTGGLSSAAIARSAHVQHILTLRTFAALRAAWQAGRAEDALDMYRPDLWPLLSRVLKADEVTMTMRMAHELRAIGDDAVWRHALGDEDGDVAGEYAKGRGSMAFLQWFEKAGRVKACDFETLSGMDADLAHLTMQGSGQVTEGAIRCLTLDPVSGGSYLGKLAANVAGDPSWRNIADPYAEAHFVQIMNEIGTTRVGGLTIRDAKLASRLFPEMLENA